MRKINVFLLAILLFVFAACENDTQDIKDHDPVVFQAEITHVSTYGSTDGAIDLSIENAPSEYSLFWSTGATTEDISGLSAGEYTVKMVYGTSSVAQKTFIVREAEPTSLGIEYEVTAPSRYYGTDGAIDVSVTAGTAPYTYLWSNDEETQDLTNISAGTYTLWVTDSNPNKPITDSVTIEIEQPALVCGVDSVRDASNYKYPTVQIGTQCWMAQNLRAKHTPEGELIDERYCRGACPDSMGAHYTWDALMNGDEAPEEEDELVQGICPDGWHVPTKEMWNTLNSTLATNGTVPPQLLHQGSSSGFDAVFAGNWGYGMFSDDNIAVFWSATEYEVNGEFTEAWYRILNNPPIVFGQGHKLKEYGLSIRCLKD